MKKIIAILLSGLIFGWFTVSLVQTEKKASIGSFAEDVKNVVTSGREDPTVAPIPTIPVSKTLPNDYHIFQTFNNCGPAALSMALSYYGIHVSQQELGQDIRPNQHPKGISDDKSVTLDELAIKASEYGFMSYHRPNGTAEIVKQFIAQDIPVVARTWLKSGEDIGHYRVVKGYDETTQSFLQDDSLQGKNLWYTYDDFNDLWEAFNFEYLVLVPAEKIMMVQKILGEDLDVQKSWEKAATVSSEKYNVDSSNIYAGFNASVAYSKVGKHDQAADFFEKVESKLPRRMLWYQLDPILSYVALANYDRAIELTRAILATENNAHAELFLIRAYIYQRQQEVLEAKSAYQQAIHYNQNLEKYQTIFPDTVVEELKRL